MGLQEPGPGSFLDFLSALFPTVFFFFTGRRFLALEPQCLQPQCLFSGSPALVFFFLPLEDSVLLYIAFVLATYLTYSGAWQKHAK